MWLNAYKASSHMVYFGEDQSAVEQASKESAQYQGEFTHNIFTPKKLKAGKSYYWRVDALFEGKSEGKVIKGDVWSFTVEQ